MRVRFTHEARREFNELPSAEKPAMIQVIRALEQEDDRLGAPHSSAIRIATRNLRELRPRAGRSQWRAFYRRIGDEWVVGAFGPEANVDPQGFRRAVRLAEGRLDGLLDQEG